MSIDTVLQQLVLRSFKRLHLNIIITYLSTHCTASTGHKVKRNPPRENGDCQTARPLEGTGRKAWMIDSQRTQ